MLETKPVNASFVYSKMGVVKWTIFRRSNTLSIPGRQIWSKPLFFGLSAFRFLPPNQPLAFEFVELSAFRLTRKSAFQHRRHHGILIGLLAPSDTRSAKESSCTPSRRPRQGSCQQSFPSQAMVTPFSEYTLCPRLLLMFKDGIRPKLPMLCMHVS